MSVSNKVKALISLSGRDNAGLAQYLKISKQALSNKLYRDSFSADDLIKIAVFTGCELSFVIDGAQKINLTSADIREQTADVAKPIKPPKKKQSK